jgi:hypothetical protein
MVAHNSAQKMSKKPTDAIDQTFLGGETGRRNLQMFDPERHGRCGFASPRTTQSLCIGPLDLVTSLEML